MNPQKIRNKMNEFGKEKKPFLFCIDFEMLDGFIIENPLNQSEILFRTPLGGNKTFEKMGSNFIEFEKFPITFEDYETRFNLVMNGLKRGDSYLVNLTVKTPIRTNLSLKDIFKLSNSPFQILVPGKFVCFSPERFVKIKEGKISTYPMKGTISTDIPNAEKLILENEKEKAEHATVVDLLRNDLSAVAENVEVARYRYIDRIHTLNGDILQVSSEIVGDLGADWQSKLGEIIFNLLPAGSISGAPKKSTMEIIRRAEPHKRGFYTGIFGYFDGNELDSGVLIRFIEEDESGQKFFYSGGGITANSVAISEYEEMLKKIYLPGQ